jgi:hypothetical protein
LRFGKVGRSEHGRGQLLKERGRSHDDKHVFYKCRKEKRCKAWYERTVIK